MKYQDLLTQHLPNHWIAVIQIMLEKYNISDDLLNYLKSLQKNHYSTADFEWIRKEINGTKKDMISMYLHAKATTAFDGRNGIMPFDFAHWKLGKEK